jgi:MoaA/NifB/PqqE/SkfB family radical SAM enzyme
VKLRREARGLHFYDRSSGLHVLLDECPIPPEYIDEGPAVISIALTNACDLSCAFCYAPKSNHWLRSDDVIRWCRELEGLGTLEIAFGGGEPTLYPRLPQLCHTLWSETNLGISITTHGQHLTDELVSSLQRAVSIIRVSIDGPEPYYSSIRGHRLQSLMERLDRVGGRIPLGINTVINPDTLPHLDEMAALVRGVGAVDWLLLPEVRSGEFILSDSEWRVLDQWIAERRFDIDLRVATEATKHLTCPLLLDEPPESYAHISANGHLRRRSYSTGGICLQGMTMTAALRDLKQQEHIVFAGKALSFQP